MKSLKKLFVAFASLGLLLTGCGSNTPSGPVGPTVVAVTGVTTTEESFTLEVGESHDLVYTIAPEDATNKNVTVASESACVSIEGTTVTGEVAGEAKVLLSTVDGNFSIAYTVTVVAPVEGMSPEEAVTDIAAYWGGSAVEVQEDVFGAYGAFPAANYSVDDMKNYVTNLFVPEEFELVSDWAVDEDGTNSCMYANAILTVLEFYVYSDTVYVKDGAIVEEGTEGAAATDVTCIEVYGYTYTE